MGGSMEEDLVEYLLSIGALEYIFDDEDGEPVYRMTPEAKDIVPNLYEDHMKDFNAVVFSLWSKDMLDVVFDDDGEPMIGISSNSLDEKKVKQLDKQEREVLQEILYIWKKKSEG